MLTGPQHETANNKIVNCSFFNQIKFSSSSKQALHHHNSSTRKHSIQHSLQLELKWTLIPHTISK